jgi:hypothetical protein
MYSHYEANALITRFNELANEKTRKTRKTLGIMMIVHAAIIVTMIVCVDWQESGEVMIPLTVFIGVSLVAILVFFLVNKVVSQSKETYRFLYPEIYRKINEDRDLSIHYDTPKKTDNRFVFEGSLFPKASTVYVLRKVEGLTEAKNPFVLYDCMLITGGGQYQQTHLNGIYLYFNIPVDCTMQLRTKGKPQIKKHQFVKIATENEFSVYKADNEPLSHFERLLIQKTKELKMKLGASHMYMNMSDGIMHLAYQSKNLKRGQRKLDSASVNEIYQYFSFELQIIDECVALTEFVD